MSDGDIDLPPVGFSGLKTKLKTVVAKSGTVFGLMVESVTTGSTSLVMFSGGRDSTLAALRLCKLGQPLSLVTVTSEHLVGLHRVERRLTELAKLLPAETPFRIVKQPEDLRTDTSFYVRTCLPCHHAYVVVAAVLASSLKVGRLAFGYAGYQGHWPEQTPLAVEVLGRVLDRFGIRLELPVYDLPSREAARQELIRFGLSDEALEQKCLRQVDNVALDDLRLRQQVSLWEDAIVRSLTVREEVPLEVLQQGFLRERS